MKVTHVKYSTSYDTWEGVYFGNQLFCENGSINLMEVLLGVVGKTVLAVEHIEAGDQLSDEKWLPKTLTEFYQKQEEGL